MKGKTRYGIIFSICIIVILISFNYSLRRDISELEELVLTSERELDDLNNQLMLNETFIEKKNETINSRLSSYEKLINKWFQNDVFDKYQSQLIKNAYNVTATVRTSSGSFELPKNGYIEVDSDFVEIEITIIEPPEFDNEDLNQRLHYYDNIFDSINHSSNGNYILENQTLTIKLDNLSNGELESIPLSNLLSELLGIDDEEIRVNRKSSDKRAIDYMPHNVKTKTFSGSFAKETSTHEYEYLSDKEWIVYNRNGGYGDTILWNNFSIYDSYEMKFKNNGSIVSNEASSKGETRVSIQVSERLILPEIIQLGESWRDKTLTATITAVDFIVKTDLGEFSTIEVTYYNNEGDSVIICYYAKDLGIIKRLDYSLVDEMLIDVEYIE